MRLLLWDGPNPDRDSALDAEVILHEYTHAMFYRLVNNGSGFAGYQTYGLDEGWADFYALALLSQSGDALGGNYAFHAYTAYLRDPDPAGGPVIDQNYYYGIREYPYSTNTSKNPLTYKEVKISPTNPYPGVDHNPAWAYGETGPYFRGQIWAAALWEARANLINKWGFDGGNQRILQFATDAMKYTPRGPNFVQARWAVIIADRVRYNGENSAELWAGFAKRGLGWDAISPPDSLLLASLDIRESTNLSPAGISGTWENKADFNKPTDTFPDLVLQQGGSMKVWFMEANERRHETNVVPDTSSTWFVKSSADINRDRKADLVFQDIDAFIAEWDMDGWTTNATRFFLPNHPGDVNWKLVATGDFNQDTKPDLVWQYEGGGSDGLLAVWHMDGITMTSSTLTSPSAPGDPKWRVVGTGDFNRDGKTDLVFQFKNPGGANDGDMAVWYMNGVTLSQGVMVNPQNPGAAEWRIVAVEDYNRDGFVDLLFQFKKPNDPNHGNMAVWYMDGVTIKAGADLNPKNPGPGWDAVAPR